MPGPGGLEEQPDTSWQKPVLTSREGLCYDSPVNDDIVL